MTYNALDLQRPQTGDLSLNPDAQIVIMTTEILRNIMYRTAETAGREYMHFHLLHECFQSKLIAVQRAAALQHVQQMRGP